MGGPVGHVHVPAILIERAETWEIAVCSLLVYTHSQCKQQGINQLPRVSERLSWAERLCPSPSTQRTSCMPVPLPRRLGQRHLDARLSRWQGGRVFSWLLGVRQHFTLGCCTSGRCTSGRCTENDGPVHMRRVAAHPVATYPSCQAQTRSAPVHSCCV